MIPAAVHICHIMVIAPRTAAGAVSAAYTGVVLDMTPTARPSNMREKMKTGRVGDTAWKMAVRKAKKQPNARVPRRPKLLLRNKLRAGPLRAATT
jgi:hypothetical protein